MMEQYAFELIDHDHFIRLVVQPKVMSPRLCCFKPHSFADSIHRSNRVALCLCSQAIGQQDNAKGLEKSHCQETEAFPGIASVQNGLHKIA